MSHDPKQGEREYYARLGPEGIKHSLAKPFSDEKCGYLMAELMAIFSLLPPPPQRVIEFGCGTGWLSLALAQRGDEVTGVDISPDAIRVAREASAARNLPQVRFVEADYETFATTEQQDFAVFHDALHHAESEEAALRCAHAALRDDGCVIVLEPGTGHSRAPGSIAAAEKYQVHEKDMPPAHVVRLARSVGFRRHLVLPHPHRVNRYLFHSTYQQDRSQADATRRRRLSVLRTLWTLARPRVEPGMVLLWK